MPSKGMPFVGLPSVLLIGLALAIEAGQITPLQVQAACCYFPAKDKDVNQPGQKAFITWEPQRKLEAFTVQPKFEGNAGDFGMVIPTPSRPKLDEMPRDFFKDLAMYTILMPLPEQIDTSLLERKFEMRQKRGVACMVPPSGMLKKDHVVVLESGVVGSLDYKIIMAEDASGLFQWLKRNHYSYGGDQATLQYYIKKKSYFTVMKIDPKQMKKASNGSYTGEITPTRFTFSSTQCFYPLKITQLSVKDQTDALFYVQAPGQMDLPGDWSWMHSYRPMYLTYMLGCGADSQQQSELTRRTEWLSAKRAKESNYETTKLEWAKSLGATEMKVLEDPQKNYGLMGAGDLPPGAKVTELNDFLREIKMEYLKANKQQLAPYAKQELIRMEDKYQPSKGFIVKYDPQTVGKGYLYSNYGWYPAREVPMEDVKGLTRLKGHLHQGQWLTKFRKILRKDEMTHDLVLAEVPKEQQQTYIRIMPTSPP